MGLSETSQIEQRVSIVATDVRAKLSGGGRIMELDGLARTSERPCGQGFPTKLWAGLQRRVCITLCLLGAVDFNYCCGLNRPVS